MLTFFAVFATLPYYISPALAAGGALGFLLVPDPVGVVQCEQYTIRWQGGVAPFSVQVRDPVEAGNIYFFNAIVSTNSIVWVVDKLGVAPGSFPLPFLVAVTDSAGSISTSAAETVAPATIPLDSSGLCTSISTAGNAGTSDPGTSSSSSSSSSSSLSSSSSAPTTDSDTTTPTTPITSPKASVTKSGSSSSSSFGSGSGSSSASTAAASGAAAPHKKISSGAIAGAVVGGVILISLLGAIFGVLRQRHHKALMDDLTANDYHLELHGKNPPAEVTEKPLPAFYEPITRGSTPGSTPSTHPHPLPGHYHDASAALHSQPSGYFPEPHTGFHEVSHSHPPMNIASQKMELERQINVMQQEINEPG